jgi:hypothetical protein
MGGTDDASNLVDLTAREHFVAHCLLARVYGGAQWLPVLHFKGANQAYCNSRLFESARLKVSNMKKGCTPWNKGATGGVWSEARREAQKQVVHRKLSEEHKEKLRKPKSTAHAENIRRAKLNQSDETKAKISFAHKCNNLNRLINSIFTPISA